VDRGSRKIVMSIKARELEEEKQVLNEYGSSDSGASLGDILGAAMNKAKAASEEKEEKKTSKKKKAEETEE
jgi:small subunit ribosomal protein S1